MNNIIIIINPDMNYIGICEGNSEETKGKLGNMMLDNNIQVFDINTISDKHFNDSLDAVKKYIDQCYRIISYPINYKPEDSMINCTGDKPDE